MFSRCTLVIKKGVNSIDAIKKRFDDLDKANPGYLEKIVQALKDRNEIPTDQYKQIKGAVESVAETKEKQASSEEDTEKSIEDTEESIKERNESPDE